MTEQEIVALTLVVFAAGFLLKKLTGWPRRAKNTDPDAVISPRLRRGLRSAEDRRSEPPPPRR